MPAVTLSPDNVHSKVLITGASGFIGQWVLKTLLDRGYDVRAVVRSATKGGSLMGVLLPSHQGQLEIVVLEDFTKEGAFDDAVVGVDAIVHVATAFPSPTEDPNETIRIGTEAAVGVVNSAMKCGDKLKRILVTSSIATIWTDQSEPRTFNEEDRNEHTMPNYNAGLRDPETTYFASKIFAEKAVMDFFEKHKGEVPWDVTFINPPYVYGPNLLPVSSPANLTSSSLLWMTSIITGTVSPLPSSLENGWVDVRDLGEAHARCLEREEAGGERILPCAGSYVWGEWFDIVRAVAPSVLPSDKVQEFIGRLPPPIGDVHYKVKYDTSKSNRILGVESYRCKKDAAKDALQKGVREGWLLLSGSQVEALTSRMAGSMQAGR